MSQSSYSEFGSRDASASHMQRHFLAETGFQNLRFRGVGRLPGLWMTMVMSGERPPTES